MTTILIIILVYLLLGTSALLGCGYFIYKAIDKFNCNYCHVNLDKLIEGINKLKHNNFEDLLNQQNVEENKTLEEKENDNVEE